MSSPPPSRFLRTSRSSVKSGHVLRNLDGGGDDIGAVIEVDDLTVLVAVEDLLDENPVPVFQVGEKGDTGSVEMSDLIITTKGPAPGVDGGGDDIGAVIEVDDLTVLVAVEDLLDGLSVVSHGKTFADQENPVPVFQVGEKGDTGSVEMSDLIITKHEGGHALLLRGGLLLRGLGASVALQLGAGGTTEQPDQRLHCPRCTHRVGERQLAVGYILRAPPAVQLLFSR
jgi:hypothetical protein